MAILIVIIAVLSSACTKGVSKEKVWDFAVKYAAEKLLKEDRKIEFKFPRVQDDTIKMVGNNRYEIKSYVILYKSECCGDFKIQDFTMTVKYANRDFSVLTFEFSE